MGVSTIFNGVYTSSKETISFTGFMKNIEIRTLNGKTTTVQFKVYLNEDKNIIFDQIRYFSNDERNVWEHSRIRDGKHVSYSEPESYLNTYLKIKSEDNNYFEFKTFEKIIFNEENIYCLVYRREFYSGKTHLRTEKLYLVDEVGVIRYEEKQYIEKFELYYQISEDEIGYDVLKNRFFLYTIFDPSEKIIIGRLPYVTRVNFKVIMNETENDPNESLTNAEQLYSFIKDDKEENFLLRLASKLATDFIDTSQANETIDIELIMNVISLDNVFFYNSEMELFYNDGNLFNGKTICAVVDQSGNIVTLELRLY